MKMKNRKDFFWLFSGTLFILIIALIFAIVPYKETVAASVKTKSDQKSFWFAVPEGGHSSATVKLTYREYYTISGSKTKYSSRSKTMLLQRAGATELPKANFGVLKHSNGKNFSSWKKERVLYGTPWNTCSSYVNSTIVTYARTTSVKGTLNAVISCSGAIVPFRAMSVSQKLNTK